MTRAWGGGGAERSFAVFHVYVCAAVLLAFSKELQVAPRFNLLRFCWRRFAGSAARRACRSVAGSSGPTRKARGGAPLPAPPRACRRQIPRVPVPRRVIRPVELPGPSNDPARRVAP